MDVPNSINQGKSFLRIVLPVSLLIPVVGMILYFSKFYGQMSDSSNIWADFAVFNGYFLGWANLIVLGVISFMANRATDAFNRLQIRPLLFVSIDRPIKVEGFKDSWYLKNGAKNVAVNVMVRFNSGQAGMTKWVSCFSLSENEKLELFWVQFADQIEVAYSDLAIEKFYKFTVKDYFGNVNEIKKEEFDLIVEEAKDNKKNNYTALRDKLETFFASGESSTEYVEKFLRKNLMP
jgi:hypothetical protein